MLTRPVMEWLTVTVGEIPGRNCVSAGFMTTSGIEYENAQLVWRRRLAE